MNEPRWYGNWAEWKSTDGQNWEMGKGVAVTASYLGHAVGDQREQAAVLLSAGLHQLAKNRYERWSAEASRRARGMTRAIGAIYPDLRNPYHANTNQMMPESLDDAAHTENAYEPIGRRFTDEDLIQWVVNDVAETFRKNSLVFVLDPWSARERDEPGRRGRLIGRTRL